MSKNPNKSAEKPSIGHRIKSLRTKKGWSMKKLAAEAKIKGSSSTMWRYENDKMHPRKHLAALASALGVSIDYLEKGTIPSSNSLDVTLDGVYAESSTPLIKQIAPKPDINFYRMIGELHILHGYNLSEEEKATLLRKKNSLGRVELDFLADYINTLREIKTGDKAEKRQKISISQYRTRKNR